MAIKILIFLDKYPDFYFPFLVMCQEYTPEDDDFVEIEPDEWENILEDDVYQTFQLWKSVQDVESDTVDLLAEDYLQKIMNSPESKLAEELILMKKQ